MGVRVSVAGTRVPVGIPTQATGTRVPGYPKHEFLAESQRFLGARIPRQSATLHLRAGPAVCNLQLRNLNLLKCAVTGHNDEQHRLSQLYKFILPTHRCEAQNH
eukprot:538745-Rhodomonas_salina.3